MCCLSIPIFSWESMLNVNDFGLPKQDVEKLPVETERPEAAPAVYSEKDLKRLKNFLGMD